LTGVGGVGGVGGAAGMGGGGNAEAGGKVEPGPPSPVKKADGGDLGGIRQLALGFGHSCALLETGRVLCWGLNYEGQAGEGPTFGTFEPNATLVLIRDTAGNELAGVSRLALGFNHSCALFEDGRIFCWGSNGFGQLGNETNYNSPQDNPRALPVQGWPPALSGGRRPG
jgi:alpha-tubulin suppressor-like RCC1 family protein